MRAWSAVFAVFIATAFVAAFAQEGQEQAAAGADKAVQEGKKLLAGGEVEQALGKFTQALEARGEHAGAAVGRATALFVLGSFEAADKSLQEYMQKVPGDEFAWMLDFVCQSRAGFGRDALRGTLSQMGATLDERSWLKRTISLFMKEVEPEEYVSMQKAAALPGPLDEEKLTPAQKKALAKTMCRAEFFVGEAALFNMDKKGAIEALKACAEAPVEFQWEKEMAKAELGRLGVKLEEVAPEAKEAPPKPQETSGEASR